MLAFDYGVRRIGVAVGQDLTGTAEALTTVRVKDGRPDWDAIARLVAEWAPASLVVGMPSTASGERPALTDAIERFARRLEGRYALPVSFVDEHLSSVVASQDGRRERGGLDAAAARVILERHFAGCGSARATKS